MHNLSKVLYLVSALAINPITVTGFANLVLCVLKTSVKAELEQDLSFSRRHLKCRVFTNVNLHHLNINNF